MSALQQRDRTDQSYTEQFRPLSSVSHPIVMVSDMRNGTQNRAETHSLALGKQISRTSTNNRIEFAPGYLRDALDGRYWFRGA
jgi:hypothetical protein